MEFAILLSTSIVLLILAFYIATSSNDMIRLLIALELMFNAIFIMLIPLFTVNSLQLLAFSILVITLFSAASEFSSLIALIMYLDRYVKSTSIDTVSRGGDEGKRIKNMYNL